MTQKKPPKNPKPPHAQKNKPNSSLKNKVIGVNKKK